MVKKSKKVKEFFRPTKAKLVWMLIGLVYLGLAILLGFILEDFFYGSSMYAQSVYYLFSLVFIGIDLLSIYVGITESVAMSFGLIISLVMWMGMFYLFGSFYNKNRKRFSIIIIFIFLVIIYLSGLILNYLL